MQEGNDKGPGSNSNNKLQQQLEWLLPCALAVIKMREWIGGFKGRGDRADEASKDPQEASFAKP